MKVTNQGFVIEDFSPKLNALRYNGQELYIDETSLLHSQGLDDADIDALIAALTEAKRLMQVTGSTPPASCVPTWILDGDGDRWTLTAETRPDGPIYAYGDMRRTREGIESSHGIRTMGHDD